MFSNELLFWLMDTKPQPLPETQKEFFLNSTAQLLSLSQCFAEIPAAIAILDRQMHYLLVTKRWQEDYKLSSDNFIGKSHYEVFPEMPESWKEIHQRCLTGSIERCEEAPFLRADGTLDWIKWEVRPWHENSGKIGGLIILTEVITTRKKLELELHKSQTQLQTILDNSQAVIYLKDREGRYLLVNRKFESIANYRSEEIQGKTDFELFPEDIAKVFRENDQKALSSKTSLQWEELMIQENKLHTYLSVKCPLLNQQGIPEGICGISTDITDQKQIQAAIEKAKEDLEIKVQERTVELNKINQTLKAEIAKRQEKEQALLYSQQRYESLIKATNQVVWVADPMGDVITDMPLWGEFTGQTPQEFQGWGWLNAIHPEDQQPTKEVWMKAVAAKSLYENEYRIKMKEGYYRHFWVRGIPILEPDGRIREWVGISTDITERKNAEEKIKALNEDLECRVAERTAQLQLINQELEAFSYSVSHDLRAPIRRIDGFSQTLLTRCYEHLDEQGKHYCNRIRSNTQKMGQLIDGLLALSRLTRYEMYCQVVNLSAIAHSIAEQLQETEPHRSVEFLITPQLITQGDSRLLRNVLENLLSNAWKYTSHHATACIEFGQCEQPNGEPAYFVRDDGAGFNMKYADQLFGAFQRLHKETDFPGIGIGLATAIKIVRRHGGKMWATGAIEGGATFFFTVKGFEDCQGELASNI
jgi:PAS domain S-box-containing protein